MSEVGEILIVAETLVYDIFERMADQVAVLEHYTTRNDLSWLTRPLPERTRQARVISADQDIDFRSFDLLVNEYRAAAADWETAAFAWTAARNHTPWLGLRGGLDDIVCSARDCDCPNPARPRRPGQGGGDRAVCSPARAQSGLDWLCDCACLGDGPAQSRRRDFGPASRADANPALVAVNLF